MNALMKVSLPLGLIFVTFFTQADTVNGQNTDSVKTAVVVKDKDKASVKIPDAQQLLEYHPCCA